MSQIQLNAAARLKAATQTQLHAFADEDKALDFVNNVLGLTAVRVVDSMFDEITIRIGDSNPISILQRNKKLKMVADDKHLYYFAKDKTKTILLWGNEIILRDSKVAPPPESAMCELRLPSYAFDDTSSMKELLKEHSVKFVGKITGDTAKALNAKVVFRLQGRAGDLYGLVAELYSGPNFGKSNTENYRGFWLYENVKLLSSKAKS